MSVGFRLPEDRFVHDEPLDGVPVCARDFALQVIFDFKKNLFKKISISIKNFSFLPEAFNFFAIKTLFQS